MDYKLPVKALFLWQIYATILAIILVLIFSLPFLFWDILAVILIGITILTWAITVLVVLPVCRKNCYLRGSKTGFYCRFGFIFHSEYFFPATRTLVVEKITTPISSALGLHFFCIKYVGHILFLPPLTSDAAKDFTNLLGEYSLEK